MKKNVNASVTANSVTAVAVVTANVASVSAVVNAVDCTRGCPGFDVVREMNSAGGLLQ